jgi:hypothetical protein
MTPKQLAKWIDSLPAATEIYIQDDWTAQQRSAVQARVSADKARYAALLDALQLVDASLAGVAEDCAIENREGGLDYDRLGHWREMHRHLSITAGMIWENAGRNVNTETGLSVY